MHRISKSRILTLALLVLALAWAGWWAWSSRWTTDDAFISFRYARNLVDGLGLVFNEGERVEGFTNLLWTLWTAVGLRTGFSAETWANLWGIGFYLGSVILLGRYGLRRYGEDGDPVPIVPVAALLAVVHRDWCIFATGGLETSLFTFLLLAGFLLVLRGGLLPTTASGAVLALAVLTRPDGMLVAAVTGFYVLATTRPRWKIPVAYALGFAALWAPATLWRVLYYGDFFPNSYYAKSAWLPWYDQGWNYLLLYMERYWILLAGPVLAVPVLLKRSPDRKPVALAAAIAVIHTAYVVRVGGDFMFARFLIPVTPFLLVMIEAGCRRLFPNRWVIHSGLVIGIAAAMILSPPPVTGKEWRHGVADEWMYYDEKMVAELDHWSEVLERYFRDLPVRVAFYGDEARIVYKAGFPYAVESHTGLTDRKVARQPVGGKRGRAGHEKLASALYLIEERKVHFTFSKVPGEELNLQEYIPRILVRFDGDVYGQVLHWDPAIMDALRARGASFPDFPVLLDRYLREIDRVPTERIARDYARFRRFYFDHVDDEARQAPFLELLNQAARR